jgi:hypothetical protein
VFDASCGYAPPRIRRNQNPTCGLRYQVQLIP